MAHTEPSSSSIGPSSMTNVIGMGDTTLLSQYYCIYHVSSHTHQQLCHPSVQGGGPPTATYHNSLSLSFSLYLANNRPLVPIMANLKQASPCSQTRQPLNKQSQFQAWLDSNRQAFVRLNKQSLVPSMASFKQALRHDT